MADTKTKTRAIEALRKATLRLEEVCNTSPEQTRYAAGHAAACGMPREYWERPIVSMIQGVASYVGQVADNGYEVASDYVLGVGVGHLLHGIKILLDGDTGRLDCGTLLSALDDIARIAGWDGGLEEVQGVAS